MSFSFESESKDKISFLDEEIFRENGRFKTTIHHIPNFSSIYNPFVSLLPTTNKFRMLLV